MKRSNLINKFIYKSCLKIANSSGFLACLSMGHQRLNNVPYVKKYEQAAPNNIQLHPSLESELD